MADFLGPEAMELVRARNALVRAAMLLAVHNLGDADKEGDEGPLVEIALMDALDVAAKVYVMASDAMQDE
jgi:hypothetical protein